MKDDGMKTEPMLPGDRNLNNMRVVVLGAVTALAFLVIAGGAVWFLVGWLWG